MEKLVACIAQVWFWPILYTNTNSLEILKVPWASSMNSLWWFLVLSIDFPMDSSQVIGWAILATLFSFSETNWEFPWLCLGSLSCWNVHPCFIFIILVGVGTEPANINFHWQGAGLLSNYWLAFYAFLHLLLSCVQYFSLCHSILLHIT